MRQRRSQELNQLVRLVKGKGVSSVGHNDALSAGDSLRQVLTRAAERPGAQVGKTRP